MYPLALILHSWLRWVAIAAGVAATASRTDRYGKIYTIVLDIQFTLGLLLYFFLSPGTRAMFSDFGAAMRDPAARFFAVEHITLMIVAVALAHVGRVRARKAATPEQAQKQRLIFFGLSTVAMIVATPWPGMASGRPLFRV
jgi:hypothetical protein